MKNLTKFLVLFIMSVVMFAQTATHRFANHHFSNFKIEENYEKEWFADQDMPNPTSYGKAIGGNWVYNRNL